MPGGSSNETEQTVVSQLSPEQRQAIAQLGVLSRNLPKQQTFGGDRVANLNQTQLAGQNQALQTARQLGGFTGQQQGAVSDLLAGGPGTGALPQVGQFGGLPELQGIQGVGAVQGQLASALTSPITEQLNEQVLPGIGQSAAQAGAFGGARQQLLEGQAREQAAQDITDTLTRAALQQQQAQAGQTLAANQQALGAQQQDFGQALGLQGQLAGQQLSQQGLQQQGILGGLGAAGGVTARSLLPSQIQQQIGGQRQAQQQAEIDAARGAFDERQQAAVNQFLQKAGILSGTPFGGGTTTSTGTAPGANPIQSALGGASIGAGIGDNSLFGGLIGGGLGLLGGFL